MMPAFSRILFISNVWPEPDSSAAGVHSLQLMRALKRWNSAAEFIWASTARPSDYALPEADAPCRYVSIAMNDEAADHFLQEQRPDLVIFDRFMAEEQFGWRVREQCPDALRMLHTQDLHFLRRCRQKNPEAAPGDALQSETALRELAAIYRSDLSLIISTFEKNLLEQEAKIPEALLHYFPLAYDNEQPGESCLSFPQRRDFVSIGNFLHPPNKDAVIRLKTHYWPEIRRRLPQAQLHVYGAYCPAHIMQMNRPEEGFLVHGRAEALEETLGRARVLLAPLRYGAGLKGKLLDAMRLGTPSVTTPVGAEGITLPENWPGTVLSAETLAENMAEAAVALHENQARWEQASEAGRRLINTSFNAPKESARLGQKLDTLARNLEAHRIKNLSGRLLWHHAQASTRYMSLWIREKEKHHK